MAQDGNGALKFMVVSLGLLLIGGFVFVVAVLMGKAGAAIKNPVTCVAEETLDLTAYGRPATTVWKENELRVMTLDPAKENSYRLITVDTCKGKIVSNLTISTQAPLTPQSGSGSSETPQPGQ